MKRLQRLSIAILVLGGMLAFLPTIAQAQRYITCSKSVTIAGNITAAAATSARTLFVSGTCVENVTVRIRVIIDGRGTATLKAADPSAAAIVFTTSTEGQIQNFKSITGSNSDCIQVTRGGVARILNNTIQNCGNDGVSVTQQAFARIEDNTIKGNGFRGQKCEDGIDTVNGVVAFETGDACPPNGGGVLVSETSAARIGGADLGNDISGNASYQVRVRRGSSARVDENTLDGSGSLEGSRGLRVAETSTVSANSNSIRDHDPTVSGEGIEVRDGSSLILGGNTTGVDVDGNVIDTDSRNTVTNNFFGLRCRFGSTVIMRPANLIDAGDTLITGNTSANIRGISGAVATPVVAGSGTNALPSCFSDDTTAN
jgi:hypothetical protein